MKFHRAGMKFDRAGTRFGRAGIRFGRAGTRFGRAGTRFGRAGTRFGRAVTRLDRAGITFDRAGRSFCCAAIKKLPFFDAPVSDFFDDLPSTGTNGMVSPGKRDILSSFSVSLVLSEIQEHFRRLSPGTAIRRIFIRFSKFFFTVLLFRTLLSILFHCMLIPNYWSLIQKR